MTRSYWPEYSVARLDDKMQGDPQGTSTRLLLAAQEWTDGLQRSGAREQKARRSGELTMTPSLPVRARAAEPAEPTERDLMSTRFRSGRRTQGQAVVEFALVLPVLILLLLIAIDFGRLFFTLIQVNNAAREAAFTAAQDLDDQFSINARAAQEANVQGQGGEGVLTVSAPTCATAEIPPVPTICPGTADAAFVAGVGHQVTISVSRQFSFLTPIIGAFFGSFQVAASSTAPVLIETAPSGGGTPQDPCAVSADFTFDQAGKNSPVTFDATDSTPTSASCAAHITQYQWNFDDMTPPTGTFPLSFLIPTASKDYGNGSGNWGVVHHVTLKIVTSDGSSNIYQQDIITMSN